MTSQLRHGILSFVLGLLLYPPASAQIRIDDPDDPFAKAAARSTRRPAPSGKAWLGLSLRAVKSSNQGPSEHVTIQQVFPGSGAQKAGLKEGDVIVGLDHQQVPNVRFVVQWTAKRRPGDKTLVTVVRNSKRLSIPVILGVRPRPNELTAATWLNRKLPAHWEFEKPLSGQGVRLAQFRGNPVLIMFWATYCGPCKRAEPWLNVLARRYKKHGLKVLKLSGEKRAVVARFLRRTGTSPLQPVLTDPHGHTRKDLLLRAMPTFIHVDSAGVVRRVSTGASSFAALDRDLKIALKRTLNRP